MAISYIIVFTVVVGIIWGIVAATTGHKPADKITTLKHIAATKQPAAKPTIPLATLNPQAAAILSEATSHYSQLFTQGKADAAQTNPTQPHSAFMAFVASFTTTNDMTASTAYNSASNLYIAGNQNVPAALDDWNGDIGQVYTDIGQWAQDEDAMLEAQALGKPADTTKVAADAQTYQTDLGTAQGDAGRL